MRPIGEGGVHADGVSIFAGSLFVQWNHVTFFFGPGGFH
jgi:hypothetical protein